MSKKKTVKEVEPQVEDTEVNTESQNDQQGPEEAYFKDVDPAVQTKPVPSDPVSLALEHIRCAKSALSEVELTDELAKAAGRLGSAEERLVNHLKQQGNYDE